MAQVVVIAKIPAAPGQRDQLIALMRAGLDAIEAESGTRIYMMHEDAVDADVLWMYEWYEDNDALAAHSGSDAFKSLGRAMKPFMGGRPEITLATPIGGKGL